MCLACHQRVASARDRDVLRLLDQRHYLALLARWIPHSKLCGAVGRDAAPVVTDCIDLHAFAVTHSHAACRYTAAITRLERRLLPSDRAIGRGQTWVVGCMLYGIVTGHTTARWY